MMIQIDKTRLEKLQNRFSKRFGGKNEAIFSSPGRIEICGNHTDHNGGKVLVGAIDCDMVAVASKADDVVILSEGYQEFSFKLSEIDLEKTKIGTAPAMAKGVLQGFKNNGYNIGGFHLVMDSKIFKGAGVSSSAAFELLIGEILNRFYNDNVSRIEMAKIGRFAENVYFGKPSGLLDQSGISLGGICEIDFAGEPVVDRIESSLGDYEIVIVNTGDHSDLTDEYSKIREDMKTASEFFGKTQLSEVSESEFYANIPSMKKVMSGRCILRAIHFFEENHRVEKACEALRKDDLKDFLVQINNAGISSELYLQNTTYPTDKDQNLPLALKIAKDTIKDGAVRVHGGGFAGTIIAFINKAEVPFYVEKMACIFGKENTLVAKVRSEGATII
ncbi:MAG: galactokinase family protein [Bacillota bacterium]